MKTNKQNIMRIILILIMIIGIGITAIKGLNWSMEYGKVKTMQISLGKEFEVNDVKNIVEEVTRSKAIAQKVEIFETTVLIKVKNLSDEQVDNILNKINEKYELEITKGDIAIEEIPNYRGRDIVKPYTLPTIISIGLILVYIAVTYRKTINIKLMLEIIGEIVITVILLLSIYAIFRIPVNSTTMGITMAAIIAYILVALKKLDKMLT